MKYDIEMIIQQAFLLCYSKIHKDYLKYKIDFEFENDGVQTIDKIFYAKLDKLDPI
jgi:hypothetical protein